MMKLKGLLITLSAIVLGVAFLGYHPLPDGIADPYKVQAQMAFFKYLQAVSKVAEFFGYGSFHYYLGVIRQARKTGDPYSASFGGLKVTRDVIAGVPVIVYQPKVTSKTYPGIVFFHGGGWVLGNPDVYDKDIYDYALQTHTVIISVDYRLAPDHPFPAAINDCLDVTRFVLKHGAQYSIDVTKVGVAGDSAGGNLAASVTLKLSKEKSDLPRLLFQVLHYPALQGFDLRLPSYVNTSTNLPILQQAEMCAFYAYYMGLDIENIDHYVSVISRNRHISPELRNSKYSEFVDVKLLPAHYQVPAQPADNDYDKEVYEKIKDIVIDPLFSPLMSPDLTGLPPAFVHAAEFDVLRDDALLYARRLEDAGVKVQLYFDKGGFHGDLSLKAFGYFRTSSGEAALSQTYAFIRSILEQ